MPKINIGITIASPLLTLLLLAFNPKLGNNAPIAFIVSFASFFFGSFIFPLIFRHQASDILRNGTYFGRLLPSAKANLNRLSENVSQWISWCYWIGAIAFVVGILFSVMHLLS